MLHTEISVEIKLPIITIVMTTTSGECHDTIFAPEGISPEALVDEQRSDQLVNEEII